MYILSLGAKLEHVSAQGMLAVNYYMCVPHLPDLKFFKSRVSVIYIYFTYYGVNILLINIISFS